MEWLGWRRCSALLAVYECVRVGACDRTALNKASSWHPTHALQQLLHSRPGTRFVGCVRVACCTSYLLP